MLRFRVAIVTVDGQLHDLHIGSHGFLEAKEIRLGRPSTLDPPDVLVDPRWLDVDDDDQVPSELLWVGEAGGSLMWRCGASKTEHFRIDGGHNRGQFPPLARAGRLDIPAGGSVDIGVWIHTRGKPRMALAVRAEGVSARRVNPHPGTGAPDGEGTRVARWVANWIGDTLSPNEKAALYIAMIEGRDRIRPNELNEAIRTRLFPRGRTNDVTTIWSRTLNKLIAAAESPGARDLGIHRLLDYPGLAEYVEDPNASPRPKSTAVNWLEFASFLRGYSSWRRWDWDGAERWA